jgi:hypothetical protein
MKKKKTPERHLDPGIEHDPKVTPKTSRQVRDYGKNKSPTTRRYYNVIAKGYANLEFELAAKNDRIAALEAEIERLTKTKKRNDGRCNTDRSECIVCAAERRELSLPAAAGGLKTMGYGRTATHRPGGVLPGGHSPSRKAIPNPNKRFIRLSEALAANEPIPESWDAIAAPGAENDAVEEVENDENEDIEDEEDEEIESLVRRTRSGRAIKRPCI